MPKEVACRTRWSTTNKNPFGRRRLSHDHEPTCSKMIVNFQLHIDQVNTSPPLRIVAPSIPTVSKQPPAQACRSPPKPQHRISPMIKHLPTAPSTDQTPHLYLLFPHHQSSSSETEKDESMEDVRVQLVPVAVSAEKPTRSFCCKTWATG